MRRDVQDLKESVKMAVKELKKAPMQSYRHAVPSPLPSFEHYHPPAEKSSFEFYRPPPPSTESSLGFYRPPPLPPAEGSLEFYPPPLPPPVEKSSDLSMPPPSGYYSPSTVLTSFSSSNDESIKDDSDSTHSRSPLKQSNSNNKGVPKKKASSEKSWSADKIYAITEVFNLTFLEKRRKESVSRAHFATVLVRYFFTKEVRVSSNVAGKRGKTNLTKR